jgi:tetratricopeptide (TPR) repeat protein
MGLAGITFACAVGGCHHHRAERLIKQKRYKAALRRLGESTYPNYVLKAKALAGMGRHKEAYKAVLKAVAAEKAKPDGPQAVFLLAARLADRLDYGQSVLELLALAQKRGKLNSWARAAMARRSAARAAHLLKMGAVVGARADLKHARKYGFGVTPQQRRHLEKLEKRIVEAAVVYHAARGETEKLAKLTAAWKTRGPPAWWATLQAIRQGRLATPKRARAALAAVSARSGGPLVIEAVRKLAPTLSVKRCRTGVAAAACRDVLAMGLEATYAAWDRKTAAMLEKRVVRLARATRRPRAQRVWMSLAARACSRWQAEMGPACTFLNKVSAQAKKNRGRPRPRFAEDRSGEKIEDLAARAVADWKQGRSKEDTSLADRLRRWLLRAVGPGHWPAGLSWIARVRTALKKTVPQQTEGATDKEKSAFSAARKKKMLQILAAMEREVVQTLARWRNGLVLQLNAQNGSAPLNAVERFWKRRYGVSVTQMRPKAKGAARMARSGAGQDANQPGVQLGGLMRRCVQLAVKGKSADGAKSPEREPWSAKKRRALEEEVTRWRAQGGCQVAPSQAVVWLARWHQLRGDAQKGAQTLLRMLQTGPEGFALCRVPAVLAHLIAQGQRKIAARTAFRLSELFARDGPILAPAVRTLIQARKWEWAALAAADWVAAAVDPGRVHRRLARLYLAAGRCDRAGRHATAMLQWVAPDVLRHRPALRLLVRILARCKRFERLAEQVVVWRSACRTALCKQRLHGVAASVLVEVGAFERALRYLGDEPGLRWEALRWTAFLGAKEWKTAEQAAKRLAEARPLDARSWCRLAQTAHRSGRPQAALRWANRAVEVDLHHPCGYRIRVRMALDRQRWAAAEAWLAWMMHAFTGRRKKDAAGSLAELYWRSGQPEAALDFVVKHRRMVDRAKAYGWILDRCTRTAQAASGPPDAADRSQSVGRQ